MYCKYTLHANSIVYVLYLKLALTFVLTFG